MSTAAFLEFEIIDQIRNRLQYKQANNPVKMPPQKQPIQDPDANARRKPKEYIYLGIPFSELVVGDIEGSCNNAVKYVGYHSYPEAGH
jgi:hypothetical protein